MNVKYLSLISLFFAFNLQAMEAELPTQTEESDQIKAITDRFQGLAIENINQKLGLLSHTLKPIVLPTLFNSKDCKTIYIPNNAGTDTFSPDGSLMAYVYFKDMHTHLKLTDAPYTINILTDPISSLRLQFNPSGTLLAAARSDGTIAIWDVSLKNIIHTFIPCGDVWTLCFSPDSKYLASYSMKGDVEIWDLTTNQCLATINDQDLEQFATGALAFNHDASLIAWANNKKILVWNIASKKRISSCSAEGERAQHEIQKLSFLKDTALLTAIFRNGEIIHLDTNKNIAIPTNYNVQDLYNIYSVASNKDGSLHVYIATTNVDHIQILYPETKSYFSFTCQLAFPRKLDMMVYSLGLKTNASGTSIMTVPRSRDNSILDIDITALINATQNWDTFLFNKDKYTWQQLFYVRALLAKIADNHNKMECYTLANSEERVIFRRLPEPVQKVLLRDRVFKGKPDSKSEVKTEEH